MIEDPVNKLSSRVIKFTRSEFQIIISSASLERCTEHKEAINKNSIAKSLSETESIELSVGFLNPSFFEVKCLSILYEVPARAAEPNGFSLIFSKKFLILFLSLLNISTYANK